MNYSQKFLDFIKKNNLFTKDEKILVAFSGGKDSVALAHLLIKNGFKVSLAHLNHKLREKESERDMNFCIDFAKTFDVEIFTRTVDIKKLAKIRKKSIEDTGREERYKFFYEIAKDYNFHKIATAHHLDDQIETFFINFFRKKSLFALQGIKLKQRKIVRPLLCFTRDDIEKYINNENLNYVDDSSNYNTDFIRNRIRLELIPFISEKFNLNLQSIIDFYQTSIKEIEDILNFIINKIFQQSIVFEDETVKVKLSNISEFWKFKFIRYEIYKNILIQLNVSYSQNLLKEIDKFFSENKKIGKFFTHFLKIFKEYDKVVFIKDFFMWKEEKLEISCFGEYSFLNSKIIVEEISPDDVNFKESAIFLDYNKVKFPLIVRFYKEGDRFMPLGMKNYVKLKDFFINQKIPFRIRRNIFIFEDKSGEIIAVGNIRISEKFKISSKTDRVLKIKILLN